MLDNAPYHSVQENKPPSKYSVKQEMMDWLEKNNVPFSQEMRKFELLELVELVKPQEKRYRIDGLLRFHGHTVIRLPPYMCELNAIELAWAKIKRVIREHNITGDLSLTKLQEVTRNAVMSVTPSDWEGYTNHVKRLEDEFWQKDGLIADTVDRIIISLGGIESSDEDEDDDASESDSSVSDSELARPLPAEDDLQ